MQKYNSEVNYIKLENNSNFAPMTQAVIGKEADLSAK